MLKGAFFDMAYILDNYLTNYSIMNRYERYPQKANKQNNW
jgi:hypothetical protein